MENIIEQKPTPEPSPEIYDDNQLDVASVVEERNKEPIWLQMASDALVTDQLASQIASDQLVTDDQLASSLEPASNSLPKAENVSSGQLDTILTHVRAIEALVKHLQSNPKQVVRQPTAVHQIEQSARRRHSRR